MTATAATRPALPARQAVWTRLGVQLGYTDTEPKRAGIRAAVAGMAWLEPDQLHDVLATGRVRYALAGLTLTPGDVLRLAAVATLPEPNAGRGWDERRLIGLQSARADRYLFHDDGARVVELWHDTTISGRCSA
jgi:hypothetical protein